MHQVNPNDINIHLVESYSDVSEFFRWLKGSHAVVAVDTETDGLDWYGGRLRLVQFGDLTTGWCISPEMFGPSLILEALKTLESKRVPLVFHNGSSFDLHWLRRKVGWAPRDWSIIHDTMLLAALIDSAGTRGLKPNSVLYIGSWCKTGQDDLKEDMKRFGWSWDTIPIDAPSYWLYSGMDTVLTANLWVRFLEMAERMGLLDAYNNERRVYEVLHKVEENGMLLDKEYVSQKILDLDIRLREIEDIVRVEFGLENITSTTELASAFMSAGVELTRKTPTGKWKMDAETVELIAATNDHPLTRLVMEYRKGAKASGTYFHPYLSFVKGDGRIHPFYRQVQARTLRMSCSDPNLQNVPRPGEDIFGVRNSFIAPEGKSLLSVDFSNVEARLFAIMAGDEVMLQAFRDGADLHCVTGGHLFNGGVPLEKKDPRRQLAKNSLFCTLFGGGPDKLAITARVPVEQARVVLDLLKTTFPTIRTYSKSRQGEMQRNEIEIGRAFITVADGRRLSLEAEEDRYYKGVNYSIQGTARYELGKALAALDNAGLSDFIVGVIHDEVLFEIETDDYEELAPEIRNAMENHTDYPIPLTVGVGKPAARWGEADH